MRQLVFATFNAQYGLRPGRDSWEAYDLVGACRRLEADVLVLQEVWRPDHGPGVLDALAEHSYQVADLPLTQATRVPGSRPRVARAGTGTVGIAVLSRFPIRARRTLPIGRVLRDPVGPRGALGVEIDVDGTAFDVVTVHTSSRVPYGPVIHLARLRPQLPDCSRPAVVAGDCNIWGPVVARVLPTWRRAVLGRTWPAHRPHSQIDHILVNERVEVLGGEVLDNVGSDHRPVRATLRIR